jgi:MFS family permease
VFSLVSLYMVRIHSDDHPPKPVGGVLANVMEGFRDIWADVPLRAFILYAGAISVFVSGPIQVGLPVLADTRLNLGAASLGILISANGGGILVGGLFSRLGTRLVRGHIGILVLCVDCIVGVALLLLTQVHSTAAGAVLLGATGLLGGVSQIALFSWVQQRVPQAMMGRTMSVLMFTFLGIAPLSAAVAGALLKVISLTALFGGAGLTLTAIAFVCLSNPALRSIGVKPRIKPLGV